MVFHHLLDPVVLSALILGFFMAWSIGANDVANAMACTVGSKILTLRMAIVIAAIFEASGALLASGQVTNMIRDGLIDLSPIHHQVDIFITGMFAALLSASTWLFVATSRGWPVSTTHTIIGAITGFGLISLGHEAIYWPTLGGIMISWVATPLLACLVAYLFFEFIRKRIYNATHPEKRALRHLPVYTAMTVAIFSSITLFRGLEALGYSWPVEVNILLTAGLSLSALMTNRLMLQRVFREGQSPDSLQTLERIESNFGFLAALTAATMAFAHGSNDVANAIGPVVAIYHSVITGQISHQPSIIPLGIVTLGAAGIVLGLMTHGYKIMDTVGSKITQLTPSRGFVAQFSTSVIIIAASGLGLPVSTTQTMVGAILGVGLARGFMALNLSVIQKIFLSWFITVPMGALLAAMYFSFIRYSLSWL